MNPENSGSELMRGAMIGAVVGRMGRFDGFLIRDDGTMTPLSSEPFYRTVLTPIMGQAGLRLQCRDCGWAHDVWMTTPLPWREMEAEADRMETDHRTEYHGGSA